MGRCDTCSLGNHAMGMAQVNFQKDQCLSEPLVYGSSRYSETELSVRILHYKAFLSTS